MKRNIQTDYVTPSYRSLAETLENALDSVDQNGPSIGDLTNAVGEKGFGLLLVLLSLPSALPVPAPGYSTPFGIVIALIALQMLMGRQTVWLPARLQRIRIKPSLAKKMSRAATKFLRAVEHLIRPRQQWIRAQLGQSGLAIVILIMACLMMLPIPLTNTLPAMVIFHDRRRPIRRGRPTRDRCLRGWLRRSRALRLHYLPSAFARPRGG